MLPVSTEAMEPLTYNNVSWNFWHRSIEFVILSKSPVVGDKGSS